MSLWSERERKIFVLKLGGAEKRYDPLRLAKTYNQAVMAAGGTEQVQDHWKRWFSPLENPGDMAEVDKQIESGRAIGNLGRMLFKLDEFSDENPDGLTDEEAINAVCQYLSYFQKKENGAESLPTASTDSVPGPGPTSEESPITPTTAA